MILSDKHEAQVLAYARNFEAKNTGSEAAFVTLMRICRDYVNPYSYPCITGEARDKWLCERLQNYRVRYFTTI